MSELKPCPRCNAVNQRSIVGGAPFFIECGECGYFTTRFNREADAIAVWNTRPQPSAEPLAVWREAWDAFYSPKPALWTAHEAAAAVIASALEAAWREALEQAAKVAITHMEAVGEPEYGQRIATAIRNLKENPNAG